MYSSSPEWANFTLCRTLFTKLYNVSTTIYNLWIVHLAEFVSTITAGDTGAKYEVCHCLRGVAGWPGVVTLALKTDPECGCLSLWLITPAKKSPLEIWRYWLGKASKIPEREVTPLFRCPFKMDVFHNRLDPWVGFLKPSLNHMHCTGRMFWHWVSLFVELVSFSRTRGKRRGGGQK